MSLTVESIKRILERHGLQPSDPDLNLYTAALEIEAYMVGERNRVRDEERAAIVSALHAEADSMSPLRKRRRAGRAFHAGLRQAALIADVSAPAATSPTTSVIDTVFEEFDDKDAFKVVD
jgi:hypothetical protein